MLYFSSYYFIVASLWGRGAVGGEIKDVYSIAFNELFFFLLNGPKHKIKLKWRFLFSLSLSVHKVRGEMFMIT